MQTLFSGVQPSGEIHLGNYLGALKQWVDLQNEYNAIFSVADLHSLTEDFEPTEKRKQIFNAAVDILAIGVDPDKAILFAQSDVKEHTELAWLFNCIVPISELERMTQFKDKAAKQKKNVNAGLLTYPALMAADILLYHAEVVPVGDDQLQHLELTRVIAKKFNNRFGEYFPEPQAKITRAARVMALNEPSKKMSKSLGPKAYIALADSAEIIKDKIGRAVTDTGGGKDKTGGGKNLLDLFTTLVDDKNIAEKFEADYQNGELQYAKFKPMLASVIINTLKPIQAKRQELLGNPDYVRQILTKGAEKARIIAEKTMGEVKKLMGLK